MGGVAAAFSLLLLPQGLCLEMGVPGRGGGGVRGVLGQAFRVTQCRWVLGRSDSEPCLGRACRASGWS